MCNFHTGEDSRHGHKVDMTSIRLITLALFRCFSYHHQSVYKCVRHDLLYLWRHYQGHGLRTHKPGSKIITQTHVDIFFKCLKSLGFWLINAKCRVREAAHGAKRSKMICKFYWNYRKGSEICSVNLPQCTKVHFASFLSVKFLL